ncbi:DUF2945 domain-containing protein [Streptomyces sp. NPDC001443]
MAKKNSRKGDTASWSSHGQNVTGTAKKKITKDAEVAGRKARASPEEPQHEVEREKNGRDAVHNPGEGTTFRRRTSQVTTRLPM